jgi:hypothetical protein
MSPNKQPRSTETPVRYQAVATEHAVLSTAGEHVCGPADYDPCVGAMCVGAPVLRREPGQAASVRG